jgi:hypothetical protein
MIDGIVTWLGIGFVTFLILVIIYTGKKILVQVFTSADGLIERVTVNHRLSTTLPWGPSIEVSEDCSNASCA